ncbi:LysR family transcriptional regulator [Planifilum fimeticola]
MEINQLEAFLQVARTKSFTRAAESLHLVQSTVTTRIQMLEKALGKPLFRRTSRYIELTPAGKHLLPYARRIIDLKREGEKALMMEGVAEEQLFVGSPHSLWDYILFPAVKKFRRKHPEIALRLITGHSDEITEKLLGGLADAGILYIPSYHPGLEVIPLREESLCLTGPTDFPLEKEVLTPEALRALPFIHLSWGTEFEQWFRAVFGRHFLPSVEVDHMSLLLRWMLTGEGVGFLLKSIAEGVAAAGELKVLPFRSDPPLPGIPVYLVLPKRKRSSGGLDALVNHLLYFLNKAQ